MKYMYIFTKCVYPYMQYIQDKSVHKRGIR